MTGGIAVKHSLDFLMNKRPPQDASQDENGKSPDIKNAKSPKLLDKDGNYEPKHYHFPRGTANDYSTAATII